jgi:hypothetical protein
MELLLQFKNVENLVSCLRISISLDTVGMQNLLEFNFNRRNSEVA